MFDHDVIIIGGGIVGVATALRLTDRFPGISVGIVEKEPALARHQSGHNSGVIHAGVYYKPGSLKAVFCKAGVDATIAFCKEHALPFDQCGKLIVATRPEDMPRMIALHERSAENGLAIERLDAAELRRREPRITGLGALYSPTTGITDYAAITRKMAELVSERGGQIRLQERVMAIREEADGVVVETGKGILRSRYLIACAGIQADRIAALSGLNLDFRMIPFRGEYYRLAPDKDNVVNHLIYPVPDPALPMLGIHLTRMIGGYVTVGPNAVLAFSREGYRFGQIDPADLAGTFGYPGFLRFLRDNLATGLGEMWNSLSKRRYLDLCRRYCPELTLDDLLPYPAGVRAQAIMRDGRIEHDFLIRATARMVHVCNAPSPAATSSIPIARHVVDSAARQFALG